MNLAPAPMLTSLMFYFVLKIGWTRVFQINYTKLLQRSRWSPARLRYHAVRSQLATKRSLTSQTDEITVAAQTLWAREVCTAKLKAWNHSLTLSSLFPLLIHFTVVVRPSPPFNIGSRMLISTPTRTFPSCLSVTSPIWTDGTLNGEIPATQLDFSAVFRIPSTSFFSPDRV